jgi:RNA polymerase-binding transcription factor DksA
VDPRTDGYSGGRPEVPAGKDRIVAGDGVTDGARDRGERRPAVLEGEHRRLVELRRAVSGDGLDDLRPTLREPAPAGRHPADTATEVADRERDLVLLGQLDQELRDVDDAIGRLERGEYGLCELCGGPIGTARLEALPATRFCIRHQVSADRGAGDTASVFL